MYLYIYIYIYTHTHTYTFWSLWVVWAHPGIYSVPAPSASPKPKCNLMDPEQILRVQGLGF